MDMEIYIYIHIITKLVGHDLLDIGNYITNYNFILGLQEARVKFPEQKL